MKQEQDPEFTIIGKATEEADALRAENKQLKEDVETYKRMWSQLSEKYKRLRSLTQSLMSYTGTALENEY